MKKLRKVDPRLSRGARPTREGSVLRWYWKLDEDQGKFLAKEVDGMLAKQVEYLADKEGAWYHVFFVLWTRRFSRDGLLLCMEPSVFRKASAYQRENPLFLFEWEDRNFWWYRDEFWESTVYSHQEVELLLWEKGRREQRKLERLAKAKDAADEALKQASRERIPEEVRLLVWERDGGRCVKCGSAEDLEYDHIIPVSKGGSSTEKNVQLLCAKCNREKRDGIV